MQSKDKIKLGDSTLDALTKMAEGNPGAAHVLSNLTIRGWGQMEGGLMQVCKLDNYGIYGWRIWMCYKDMCEQDIDKLYELLKNNQLEEAIKKKCSEDETFNKQWHYSE